MASTSREPTGNTWRFLDTGPADGFYNMALDEALALKAERVGGLSTLRVFGWQPPAISLGYHQRIEEIDVDSCAEDGIDVVRRSTGGRAILHHEELTYSVIIPADDPAFRAKVNPAYESISRALVRGLSNLGIGATFERAEASKIDYSKGEFSVPCFSASIRNEVVWQGRKLVGSAQRRLDGALLQHGSILLGNAHLKLVDYLAGLDEGKRERQRCYLQKHTVTVNEIAGRRIDFVTMAQALVTGFEEVFGVKMAARGTTVEEEALAQALLPKYKMTERRQVCEDSSL